MHLEFAVFIGDDDEGTTVKLKQNHQSGGDFFTVVQMSRLPS